MKSLALLPIVGAFSIFGSAFSGVWTPPGLNDFPTYEVVLKHTPWGAEEEEERSEPVSLIVEISDDQQFRPEGVTGVFEGQQFRPQGVTGDWKSNSLVELQPYTIEEIAESAVRAQALAARPAPVRRKIKWTKYVPIERPSPYKSYTLAGSRVEFRAKGD